MSDDPYDLARFVKAQDPVYETVCEELREGHKRTHWMWFVFPILTGLAKNTDAMGFAISSLEEARAYCAHDVLADRLRECVELAIDVDNKTAREIFGETDDWKLHQCLTLNCRRCDWHHDPVDLDGQIARYEGHPARHIIHDG